MSTPTTRRGALAALAGTAVVAGAIGVAIATPAEASTGAIERHWRAYLAAQREIYDSPDATEEESRPQEDRLTTAEDAILKTKATTTREAAIKLWVSLPHADTARWIEESIAYGRFSYILANEVDLDFAARLAVHAIAALGWED